MRILVSHGEAPANRSDHGLVFIAKPHGDTRGFDEGIGGINPTTGVSQAIKGAEDRFLLIDSFSGRTANQVFQLSECNHETADNCGLLWVSMKGRINRCRQDGSLLDRFGSL
jgi:hypothetical protein